MRGARGAEMVVDDDEPRGRRPRSHWSRPRSIEPAMLIRVVLSSKVRAWLESTCLARIDVPGSIRDTDRRSLRADRGLACVVAGSSAPDR